MRLPLVVAAIAIAVIAVSAAFLFLIGRPPAGGSGEGVVLILDRTELRGDRKLTYTIVNRSEREISFGEPYDVQIRRGGEWVSVEWMRDRVWIAILYSLKPGESFSRQVELPDDVEPGTYRIVKEVMFSDSGERLTLMAEFVVVE